ncbi:ATP-binding cassette, subfamily B [Streptomyces sp. DfronAA-171]|nr:ATP-binding cassette, subfamily B [Streptomyces sp. DfronAA-171]
MLIRLLRASLAPYKRPIALLVLLQFVQTCAALYLPTLNADIIDNGVVKGDTGYIMEFGGLMLIVAVVQMAGNVGAVFYGARTAAALGRDVRARIFDRVQSFSAREVGQFGAPTLITRTTNDVQQVQMLVLMSFTLMVSAPIMCVGGVILALGQDVPLSSILLVVIPVLGGSVGLIVRKLRPLFRTLQTRLDTVNRVLREQITGNRVIRAFVRDEYEGTRFDGANGELTEVSLGTGRLFALMFPTVMTVVNLSSVAVVWFGSHRIDSGGMQIGALTAFLSYLMQIVMAVMMATFMFMMVPRAEVCAERIEEVLDTASSVVPPQAGITELRRHGRLELRGAGFRFPGAEEPVLRGIDLEALPGETTAVIGSTGSGKTTLLGLVPRLFDATEGEVLVDGVDVREVDPALLARTVGLVPQKPYLFVGDGREQSALREPGRERRGAVARAGGRAGQGLRGEAGAPAGGAGGAGRLELLGRAAAAARDRAHARAAPGDLPLRRLLLGARLRDGRGAARGARPRDGAGDGGDRGAARRDDPRRGPHPRARRGADRGRGAAPRADGDQ